MRRPGNLAGITSPFGDDDGRRTRRAPPPPPPPPQSRGVVSKIVEAVAPKPASPTVKVAPALTSVPVPLTVNSPSPAPVVSSPTPAYAPTISNNRVVDPADPNLPLVPSYYVPIVAPIISAPMAPANSSEAQTVESQRTQEDPELPFGKQGLVGMLVNLWNRVFFE